MRSLVSASETRRPASNTTSNADFFVRNHFAAPKLSDETWTLDVAGLVSKPVRLSYSDLLLMPSVRQAVTLECAGNPPGGGIVGTSVWSGVPLAALLKQADVRQGASTVVLHGADSGDGERIPPGTHFARSIPIEKAMEPSTLLAYEMNGDPLPAAHGFPVRALVSGWYGMDSVKWLTRIEVLNQPFAGYFQQEEYVSVRGNGERQPITRMSVSSKMVRPSEGEEIRSGAYRVEGLAWAGERKGRESAGAGQWKWRLAAGKPSRHYLLRWLGRPGVTTGTSRVRVSIRSTFAQRMKTATPSPTLTTRIAKTRTSSIRLIASKSTFGSKQSVEYLSENAN